MSARMPAAEVASPAGRVAPPIAVPRALRVAFVMEQVVGHAVQALHLLRNLADHPEVRPQFVPVTFHQENGLVERLPLPAYLRGALRARFEVRRGLAGWRPDAFFWNTQKPALLAQGLLRAAPSVISLDVTPRQYDAIGEHYGHTPDGGGLLARAKHRANRRLFHLATRLLPATAWVRRSLIEDYGVPPERIEVLPPGTSLERFRPNGARPSDADGVLRVLFVGGDFQRKGGDTLLEWLCAAPTARRCVVHAVTREVLPPVPRLEVHRLAYDDARLPDLYREADVFVLPTRAECFGLVLTEAMACAVPVIATPVGGLAEVVQDGETGLLVPPDDVGALERAMSALATDAALRHRLGRRGREVAEERFDARKNVARIVEVLHEVVEGPA